MSQENLVVCSQSVWNMLNWWTEMRKKKGTKQKASFHSVSLPFVVWPEMMYRQGKSQTPGKWVELLFSPPEPLSRPYETVMYVKALSKLQNILQIGVPSSSSWHSHTTVWKLSHQTIINQVAPFCPLLQPAAKYTLKRKADSLTKPKWKIKWARTAPHPKRANPHCLEEEIL